MSNIVIVGSGPAGVSAALYAVRAGVQTTVLTKGSGALARAETIENYYGFAQPVSGQELERRSIENARRLGVQFVQTEAVGLTWTDRLTVETLAGAYPADAVILATGASRAVPRIPGLAGLEGHGVSYCATCDGMFYKDKRIAVICNDKKYEHEVKYLADLAAEVLYFPAYNDSEIELPNVKISKDVPIALIGDSFVEGITLRSGKTESVDGVFCLRNAIAPSKLMPQLEIENGHILVDRAQQTNVAGCFAAGDCTGRPYQYTKAVGEGNVAAHSCIQYLSKSEK